MKKISELFIVWRLSLIVVAILATILIPNFGGRFPYSETELIPTGLPNWIWGFGNFDGVHYLRIAQHGYTSDYTQAFFPLYPLIIKLFSFLVVSNKLVIFTLAILISSLSFFGSLFILYKLFRLDFPDNISLKSIILFLAFPTSFYFGAIYSESLFLLWVVLCIYFIRKQNLLLGGVFAGLASSTRVVGIFLLVVLLIEVYRTKEFRSWKSLLGLLLAPLGLIFYMIYLKLNFNDPLYFLNSLPAFGTGRSSDTFTLLPQVLFRYLKIFFTTNILSLSFFNALLEFLFTLAPLILVGIFYKKIRLSYIVFTLSCILLPTFTGTLTSMPRYALMIFLVFPILTIFLGRYFKLVVISFIILQTILLGLFIRGYWVA